MRVRGGGGRLGASSGSATGRDWLRGDESTEVSPGVSQGQRTAVAEAGVPQQGQVDSLKLGQAQVLSSPGLDVFHTEESYNVRMLRGTAGERNLPVHNDWSPEHVGQTEDVQLLQTLPGLTGQRQQA